MSRLADVYARAARPTLWLAILLCLSFALYLPGIDAPYIGDDFMLTFSELPSDPLCYFYTSHHMMVHYRPFQLILHNLVHVYFGSNTVPIHIVHFLGYGLFAIVTYCMLQAFGLSRLQATIAALYVVVTPASTFALESNDTGPQVWASLLSYVSLWLLFLAYQRRSTAADRSARWLYLGSVAAFALALLTKEISLAFLFLNGLLILYQYRDIFQADVPRRRQRVIQAMRDGLPYVALAGLFCLIQSLVGVMPVHFAWNTPVYDRYAFQIGPQILINIGMLLFASFQPTSSADLYLSLYAHDYARVALHGVVVLIFLAALAWGIWRARRVWLALIFLGGMAVSYFPVFFLGQAAESYTSNGLPLAAGIVGLGLGTLIARAGEISWRRGLAWGGTALLLVVCAVTVRDKIARIQATGDKIPRLMKTLAPYLESTPDDQYLFLLDDQPAPQYSLYEMGGIQLLLRWNLNERLPHPLVYGLTRQEMREAEADLEGGCTVVSVRETSAELIYQNDTECRPDL